ncbi:hypothetical protein MSG28_000368 [Choristoneura fumiferana]|uniref:Uncharacterized protein n=1 Tax=Choristoneura fumiferana TaxID=7141 RepID=A0ACC0K0H6_CHOFU|nr:hypothetical protein MSG28_000368 [Choristoneura fumiferana]
MFKKLKDKLAEEVKSSPQRIQQFAQAAQDGQHQRRLSNSSFASDVSFRLPSYESPSLYHLQSDMEVSASEAEERGFSSGTASLDRVTKEQLYAAYKRTQQRYEKYRTQYADLARHYKFLERDNAKARAHLEKALRLEIDERNMKIESLNTKISFMQNNLENKNLPQNDSKNEDEVVKESVKELQLIDFSGTNDRKTSGDDGTDAVLNSKTEKLEQLVSKYKESLKQSKEKNAQLTTELHILSIEVENKKKENEQLKESTTHLTEARQKILELQEINEEFQNKLNTYEFNKMKEKSTLELDLQKALEEIEKLRGKVEVFNKREEEYAISLAENKLSIHKELETKEAEIKSLKDNLTASKNEIQSLNIVVTDYKTKLSVMEDEKNKLNSDVNDLNSLKTKLTEKESKIKDLEQKCKSLEQSKAKADEEYKCLQLQHKQETAEKLAMIDRNVYLETKNTQLAEENAKKSLQIIELESKLLKRDNECNENQNIEESSFERNKILEELESWRNKYYTMESEIQDERDELVKLQSEIEKLLQNHEVIQRQNSELLDSVSKLTIENTNLKQNNDKINKKCLELANSIQSLKGTLSLTCEEAKLLKNNNETMILNLSDKIIELTTAMKENELGHQIKFDNLKHDYEVLQKTRDEIEDRFKSTKIDLIACQEDNNQLQIQIQAAISENTTILEKIKIYENNHEINLSALSKIKEDKTTLLLKIDELESLNKSLQDTITREKEQNSPLHDKLPLLEKEQQILLQKLKYIEDENDKLKTAVTELDVVKAENQELLVKNKISEDKQVYIEKLEDDVKALSQENTSLKNQSQSIAVNLKALEEEISDVRKSHAEIESEKDHLNATIKKLEESENAKKIKSAVEIQTDETSSTINYIVEENKILKDKCEQFKQEKETLYEKCIGVENEKDTLLTDIATQNSYYNELDEEIKSLKLTNSELLIKISELERVCNELNTKAAENIELADKFTSLKTEYDTLKNENRHLSSDIEGLQTYLAKISKENGTLNDKVRELITSSEHVDQNHTSRDLNELQNVKSDTDKMNDLLRENTLLVEENLELKDQLRSQNYAETPNSNSKSFNAESELDILKEKYNSVLATKSKYEKQLMDLEHINRSVNGNLQNVQENNEKLRLSNDKLERRLDEALVSLRHLHSLQENTELEYLRNILYEYLTGSGTHSITLAKVLAAVVKFDEMQTNIVMQKEKERQGLLRQLGLL